MDGFNHLFTFFSRFYTYLPGAAYMLGYSQKQQHGPSHQAAMVMALTSPRTCDVVLKLPEVTTSTIFCPGALSTYGIED